jgi:hypothetical protein
VAFFKIDCRVALRCTKKSIIPPRFVLYLGPWIVPIATMDKSIATTHTHDRCAPVVRFPPGARCIFVQSYNNRQVRPASFLELLPSSPSSSIAAKARQTWHIRHMAYTRPGHPFLWYMIPSEKRKVRLGGHPSDGREVVFFFFLLRAMTGVLFAV